MGASNVGNKSICLPVPSVAAYEALISNPVSRRHVKLWAERYPEIFLPQVAAGFWFHNFVASWKLNLRMRRIRLVETGEVYQLRPELIMSYMVGRTDEVERGLYLRRYGVPSRHGFLFYSMQYSHGTLDSARLHLRAMALLWNFHPYGSRTKFNHPSRSSPFEDLNGFQYHDDWLQNLLIASSTNGRKPRYR